MKRITEEQKCKMSIQPVTAKGRNAKVDGAIEWISSDATIIVPVPDETDPLSAYATTPEGTLGSATVSVRFDADLGEGVRHVEGTVELFEVVGAEAGAFTSVVGEPETD